MSRLARLAPLLIAGVVVCGGPALAAESISLMEVHLTVNADASVLVQEKIVYDFEQTPERHGIYRDIPLTFSAADGREQTIIISDLVVVDPEGTPYETKVTRAGGVEHIRVGDPDQ